MNMTLRFCLVTVASLSPLLTFASLWQIKEWRVDRLREHLRSSGVLRQLFGITRPAILLIGISLLTIDITLAALAAFSVLSFGMRRQRYPVWTMKAIIVIFISFSITALLGQWAVGSGQLATGHWPLVILPLIQPLVILVAWLFFLPIDMSMKKRIMQKAMKLRSEFTNTTVIGITGSVGKTTTKELIAHVLKKKNVLCTPAYVNSEMGVSQWLLKELPAHNREEELIIIVEMGAYKAGEIKRLCDITKPHMGVVTFIGSQHIALFGSQEKLCQAKGELLEALPKDGKAFINGDNSLCESMKGRCNCAVVSVGTGGHADLEAFDIEETSTGITFRAENQIFSLRLHGTHNVTNVLLSIAVAAQLDVSLSDCATALRTFEPPHHTFSVRKERGVTILDDTHNASPSSFRASLAWAKSHPAKKKILITPGLIELGKDEDRIHQELGAASNGVIDRVIFTGKHGKSAFAKSFTGTVETISKDSAKTSEGDLLLCVGRINQNQINNLLP